MNPYRALYSCVSRPRVQLSSFLILVVVALARTFRTGSQLTFRVLLPKGKICEGQRPADVTVIVRSVEISVSVETIIADVGAFSSR